MLVPANSFAYGGSAYLTIASQHQSRLVARREFANRRQSGGIETSEAHVINFSNVFGINRRRVTVNEQHLALYMGYAFSHAINVQHLLAPGELMVPYVVYWDDKTPTPTPYPAPTQHEAVANARSAREQAVSGSGWSSGREGLITQSDGTKMDILLIEGWVPGLDVPLEMFVYYRAQPFRLIHGFIWKEHALARKDGRPFMPDFKQGILMQPFGRQCLQVIEQAERVQFTR